MYLIDNILKLFQAKHPVVDGSNIFIIGNTWKRKLMIKGEQLQSKAHDSQPAGCYHRYCNQIYITPYAMFTNNNKVDYYGTTKSITRIANIISHEFNHMLFQIEHGLLASIGLDALCGYSSDLNNSGLSDKKIGYNVKVNKKEVKK